MLLEKQELNEPLRQPTSFLVLQVWGRRGSQQALRTPVLRLQSPKGLHWLEMPGSCLHVTSVAPALSACSWSCGSVTATPSVMCAPTMAAVWNRRAISLWRIRSTVESMPRRRSPHRGLRCGQRSRMSQQFWTQCCFPHSLAASLSSESCGLSLPNSHLCWFYHWY